MNTIESILDISLYLMLIISLNLMKIKYCDTETLSSIRAFVHILKTSTMLYILLDNKKRNHTFVINTTITYIIKALLLLTMLLLLIKETYNLLYLHLLKLSHERLTVMLITKKCAYHVIPHTKLAPPHLLIYRKYAFFRFQNGIQYCIFKL